MKQVFHIMLPGVHAKTGAPVFMNFETHHSTLELFVADLNEGVLIAGDKLDVRPTGERGVLEVWRRRPCALRREGVARVEMPSVRFIEYEDAAE